jgi:SAM-dependent methyltransferase
VGGLGSAELQRRYFEAADPARFRWTTSALGFAETEDALLAPLLETVEGPCLEIGCGEGNNLVRLLARASCTGVDLFLRKLRFAARQLPAARFAAAEASRLPFRDGCYRTVFVRDLLHHLPDPAAVLDEALRVLSVGGSLLLLEPNGRNPLVYLQTLLVPAERGARRSSAEYIANLLRPLPLEDVTVNTFQPFPLRRLVLHYRFGIPVLGRPRLSRRALAGAERAIGALVPASRWSYVVATARRSPRSRVAPAGGSASENG